MPTTPGKRTGMLRLQSAISDGQITATHRAPSIQPGRSVIKTSCWADSKNFHPHEEPLGRTPTPMLKGCTTCTRPAPSCVAVENSKKRWQPPALRHPSTLAAAATIGRSVSTHVDSDMRLDGKVEMGLNQRNASLPQDSLEVPLYLLDILAALSSIPPPPVGSTQLSLSFASKSCICSRK